MRNAIKELQRRYPNVVDDVQRAGKLLLANPTAGDVVPGGKGCRKLRVANSDARKGKSGGYRLIYYLIDEPNHEIHLLFIYSKNTQADIPPAHLIWLLKEAGLI